MPQTFDEMFEEEIEPNLSEEARALQGAFEDAFSRASQLASRRVDMGLTQQEVAERAGLTQADVSRLERGLGNPTDETFNRVAKALSMRWKYELVPA